MKRFAESAFAVWCAALIVTAVGISISRVDWPCWKDAFWAAWAQTIGAIGTIVAALQIGNRQLRAAEASRRTDLEDERERIIMLLIDAIQGAMTAVEEIITKGDARSGTQLGDFLLGVIGASERTIGDLLLAKIPTPIRFLALEAKGIIATDFARLRPVTTTAQLADHTIEDFREGTARLEEISTSLMQLAPDYLP